MRKLYLRFTKASLGHFSRLYLRTNFLKNCLSLYSDKAVAVKGNLANMLSDIKKWIKPDDN